MSDKIIPFPTNAIHNIEKTGHTDKKTLPVDEQKTLKTYLEENCWDWTVIDKETVMGSFDTQLTQANKIEREK